MDLRGKLGVRLSSHQAHPLTKLHLSNAFFADETLKMPGKDVIVIYECLYREGALKSSIFALSAFSLVDITIRVRDFLRCC